MYSSVFKSACPKSYSYAYDDATSTFTCSAADYTVAFCPTLPSLKSSRDLPPPPPKGSTATTWGGGGLVGFWYFCGVGLGFGGFIRAGTAATIAVCGQECGGGEQEREFIVGF
ncbi:unnamed protein product [Linum tenue]|uniref:Thaumatin-like protein n=1 Tax=Linum tenue TaxID=586396 RepID=A0AAV0PY03_9ROSI|nr:unnamed protein product [Linum tenue]